MKKAPRLTPFEQVILAALKGTKVLTFEALDTLEVPARLSRNSRNKMAVHMKELRKKTGMDIENVRGVGYRLVN